ncbi:MAG: DUF1501 domain-containing protein [Planctomycetes bacterium]|nr:DUF1501 domain-containing protein [Planctomycetota bacterium]
MLSLIGGQGKFCDGVSRRSFLQIGALAMGGLSLPTLLQAEQQAGSRSHKAVIMVYLSGGMSHHDTFDMKPDAPAEIRGEFSPIATNVNGIRISEFLPRLAGMMDKISVVRSLVGLRDEHSSFQTTTGYGMGITQREGRPNAGSVVSRVLGRTSPVIPAYVDLFPTMQHRPYNIPGPGFAGPSHAGAKVENDQINLMRLAELTQSEFRSRRALLESVDRIRRSLDRRPLERMDISYRQAFEVLTSNRLVDALDLTKESPSIRARYGFGSSRHQGDGAPLWNDQLLMARRLVEAGVRCVSVAYGFWDTHGGNFRHLRGNLPVYDCGISALVEDLHQRGLDRDVSVIVWGEFGRTPRINRDVGRDHWAPVNTVLMAGGGMPTGQLLGATDRIGAYATQNPIHYRNILATLYHNLGIDPHTIVRDVFDRPTTILPEDARPVRELCA